MLLVSGPHFEGQEGEYLTGRDFEDLSELGRKERCDYW